MDRILAVVVGGLMLLFAACVRVPPSTSGDPQNANTNANDNSQPDPDCGDVDLSGLWFRKGQPDCSQAASEFIHKNGSVDSTYVGEKICCHRDDIGTTSQFTGDFSGTLDGCNIISGTVVLCKSGCTIGQAEDGDCSLSENGIIEGTIINGSVEPGGKSLSYAWQAEDRSGFDIYIRMPCSPKDAAVWGLNDREWTRQFISLTDAKYVTNEQCGTPAAFNAGVFGTVTHIETNGFFFVSIRTENGELIEFHSFSQPGPFAVEVGDAVTPSTNIGLLLDPCENGLEIFGEDGANPDCVE